MKPAFEKLILASLFINAVLFGREPSRKNNPENLGLISDIEYLA